MQVIFTQTKFADRLYSMGRIRLMEEVEIALMTVSSVLIKLQPLVVTLNIFINAVPSGRNNECFRYVTYVFPYLSLYWV